VLDVLIHELIHVADDNEHGHKGPFAEWATRLGLQGRMTATTASVTLAAEMVTLAATLGEYPHAELTPLPDAPVTVPATPDAPAVPRRRATSGPAKQTTRMLKVQCTAPDCACGGYVVRTTARWLAIGTPMCPMGTPMTQD
jgi:hypothetical protein